MIKTISAAAAFATLATGVAAEQTVDTDLVYNMMEIAVMGYVCDVHIDGDAIEAIFLGLQGAGMEVEALSDMTLAAREAVLDSVREHGRSRICIHLETVAHTSLSETLVNTLFPYGFKE